MLSGAVLLGQSPNAKVVTDYDVFRDINILKGREVRRWREIDRNLRAGDDPTALEGLYAGLQANPPDAALTAVTGVTARTALWDAALFTPLPLNNQLLAPTGWFLHATGVVTSDAAARTITMTPGLGTTAAATTMGASTALALGSTITGALWTLEGRITVRAIGTAASAYGIFEMHWGTTAGATATVSNALFGNTAAAFDSRAKAASATAGGIEMDVTPNAVGVSMQVTQLMWVSLN